MSPDSTAAGGIKLATPDNGWATLNVPLAVPTDYVDVTFTANAGTPYTFWMRMQALASSKWNDAVWVQFSDAVAGGMPVYGINTSSGLLVNLATDGSGLSLSGWGWANGCYWLSQATTITFANSGTHTVRIQVREDGVQFDQLVLSPSRYLSAPPGGIRNDRTIVPKPSPGTAPSAPTSPTPPQGATGVSTTATLTWSSTNTTSYDVKFGTTNPPPTVSSGQPDASFTPPTLVNGTTYFWQVVARNSNAVTAGPVWSFTTTTAPAPPSGNIVIYASDLAAGSMHGNWSVVSDSTSPNNVKMTSADNGWSTTTAPLAAPADYIDVAFNAKAGTPYTLWLRLQATARSKYNDSIWVQFSDAQAGGRSLYPIDTTSGLLVNLATDSAATSLDGWGWQNAAYWLAQPTTIAFATSGTHLMRIQTREDGVQWDQIVLSPNTYLNAAPGPVGGDHTIVPKQ
jgi:hypothetical protein